MGNIRLMYNFFVSENQIIENKVYIEGQDAIHIGAVLRMKPEDKIYICEKESKNRYLSKILEVNKNKVIAEIIRQEESTELKIDITIYQGLPKFDKMELIIQKSVELGASKIVPVDMKYCVTKMRDEDKKISRWNTISETAAKQSKRTIIPKVERMTNIENICKEISNYDTVLIAYEDESKQTIKDILRTIEPQKVAIIIGPEGGIAEEEVKKLKENGAKAVSLGKRILRTETAAMTALSMMIYEYEM